MPFFLILQAIYIVAGPIIISLIYAYRQYLPICWGEWIDTNPQVINPLMIVGTVLWIILAIRLQLPSLKKAYYQYLRPQIQFKVDEEHVSPEFGTFVNGNIFVEPVLSLKGYFANQGNKPSTVINLNVQFVKRFGFFRRTIGKARNAIFFLENTRPSFGTCYHFYIEENKISPKIEIIVEYFCNLLPSYENLGSNEYFEISWEVLGQPIKSITVRPDWRVFKRDVRNHLRRLNADKSGSQS
jgi:hypothetical protein